MPKTIHKVRDALRALAEAVAALTLPQPKLVPIKVVATKR